MSVIVTDTGFTPVADSVNPGLDAREGATALVPLRAGTELAWRLQG